MVTLAVIGALMLGAMCVLSFVGGTPEARWELQKNLPFAMLFFALFGLPMYLSDIGYQVGWDENGIYMRMPGWRFEALFQPHEVGRDYKRPPGLAGWLTRPPVAFMPYEDIQSVDFSSARPPTIYIKGRADPAGLYNDLIGIDLESFSRASVLEFMSQLSKRRPSLSLDGWTEATGLAAT